MFSRLQRLLTRSVPPIPDIDWAAQLRALPLLQALDPAAQARLRGLCAQFLAHKRFAGAAGLDLTDAMRLHIAAQACLPVLNLGLQWYRGWSGIVVYPAAFRVRRQVHDDDGLVHDMDAELSGEAWEGGPVVLSWEDAGPGGDRGAPHAANVVIHEFAHKLDLLDGVADGIPPFSRSLHPDLDRQVWAAALDDAFERFCAGVDLAEDDIPPDVDPESDAADAWYARLPLDPYAATDPAEFFAVSSEALFLSATRLRDAFPQWHSLLQRFYWPSARK